MSLNVQASASPAAVRAWAQSQGIPVGPRGKFSDDLVRTYNAKHALKYRPGKHVKTVPVAAVDGRGRSVVRKINFGQARAVLLANGHSVPKRGPLSRGQIALALSLSKEV